MRQVLPSRRRALSRELHALSSAPHTAQAGVIDAGRGLAEAVPTACRDPAAGPVPSRFLDAASGRRCHPHPTRPTILTLPLARPAANKALGPGDTERGLRHGFKSMSGSAQAGKAAETSEYLRQAQTPFNHSVFLPLSCVPAILGSAHHGSFSKDTGVPHPKGNAYEPAVPLPPLHAGYSSFLWRHMTFTTKHHRRK